MRMNPSDYYTLTKLKARLVNDPPRYLFYFCHAHEVFSRMHHESKDFMQTPHGVAVTESPHPGVSYDDLAPVGQRRFVFVFDSECVLDFGFVVYPFTYNNDPWEAEWRIIDGKDAEFTENPFAPVIRHTRPRVLRNIPFSCLALIGVMDGNRVRPKRLIPELKDAIAEHGFELNDFKWKEWWDFENGPIRRAKDA